jgi:hypothetical protein
VQPVLQRADGTFVGTVVVETNGFPLHNMVAFTLSGQLLWRQTDYTPQIATDGGGVIATSLDGLTIATFDTNGNQTGKLASLPTYSWTGSAYKLGSVESFYTLLLRLENSFSPFSGANASGNNGAVNFFPPLATCTSIVNPPTNCLMPGDAIWNAYQDLVAQLTSNKACSSAAQLYLFDILNNSTSGGDTNRNPVTTSSFLRYLSNSPHFSDGTQSTWDYKNAWCGSGKPWWSLQRINCSVPFGSPATIEAAFLGDATATALTETPSDPFTVFFRPSGKYGIQLTSNGKNLFNEAVFFHESLHGISGQSDSFLEALFTKGQEPSSKISDYIQTNVLSRCPIGRNGGN